VSFGSADQWVSPAIGADGIIFIGSYGDERSSSSGPLGRKFGRLVFAITPEGKTKWTFKAEDALKSTPAVASDGTIYIMDWLTRLYALRADGKLKWKINLIKDGRAYNSAPAIGSHGTIYVNAENNLFAVTPSGKVKWKFTASDNVGSPAVSQGRSPELVYFGSRNQFLYCVFGDGSYDKEGKEYWHVSPGATSTPVLGGGGVCCAAVTAGLLGTKPGIFCVTPQLIWKYEWDEKYVPVSIPAVGPDETVYLIHMKKGLLAFTPKGKLKWVLKPEIVGRGPGFRGSPAIDRNGTLYVGTSNGVWAVNPKGKIEWKLNLNESAGSPAIGYNQTLYVATWEGHLFAIGE
jgi:outer membrane protein assembly factor BamB